MYIKANNRKELLEWANDFLKTYDLTPDEDENRAIVPKVKVYIYHCPKGYLVKKYE